MFTVYVCEDCGRSWDREVSPRAICPRCGGGGRIVADDQGEYCFWCGALMGECCCDGTDKVGWGDEGAGQP